MTSKENEYFYDCISEFLEVAFHSILYVRGVYPSCIFSRAIKYDIPVPISRSDTLNKYISNSIDSLNQYFLKDAIEKLSLTILNENDIPVEKFYFEFSSSNNNNKNNSNNISNNNNGGNKNEIVELNSNGFSQTGSPLNFYINLNKKILNNNQNNNNDDQNNNSNNNPNNNQINNSVKPNILQLESSFKAFLLKILMTSDSFYDSSNYNSNNSSNDSFESSSGDDEMLEIGDNDGITILKQKKRKKQKKDNINNNGSNNNNDSSNGNGNKNLRFTIHVYTKNNFNLTNQSISNNSILNINPLETPKTSNINNQTKPVWISASKSESEIQDSASFIIPLNSDISDGKNRVKAFTEQSISK